MVHGTNGGRMDMDEWISGNLFETLRISSKLFEILRNSQNSPKLFETLRSSSKLWEIGFHSSFRYINRGTPEILAGGLADPQLNFMGLHENQAKER